MKEYNLHEIGFFFIAFFVLLLFLLNVIFLSLNHFYRKQYAATANVPTKYKQMKSICVYFPLSLILYDLYNINFVKKWKKTKRKLFA